MKYKLDNQSIWQMMKWSTDDDLSLLARFAFTAIRPTQEPIKDKCFKMAQNSRKNQNHKLNAFETKCVNEHTDMNYWAHSGTHEVYNHLELLCLNKPPMVTVIPESQRQSRSLTSGSSSPLRL